MTSLTVYNIEADGNQTEGGSPIEIGYFDIPTVESLIGNVLD